MPNSFLGTGLAFPIRINAHGGFSYSRDEQKVQEAIWIVLSTAAGERVMRPQFGAGVHEYVFQTNTPQTRTQLAEAIRGALVRWEPRIQLDAVRVDPGVEPSQVLIAIDYRIRATNELFNLVYPFYLQEGAT